MEFGFNSDKKTKPEKRIIANKQFKAEDSLLTVLIANNSHVCSLHNMILGFVTLFSLVTIGDYITQPERFYKDYSLFYWNISGFPHFIFVWSLLHASLLLILYPLILARNYIQWKRIRKYIATELNSPKPQLDIESVKKQTKLSLIETVHFSTGYASIILFGLIYFSYWYILHHNVNITVTFALTMEMIRLAMKAHSYFIETATPTLEEKSIEKLIELISKKSKSTYTSCTIRPKLFHFIYFLFAPTLIYRDTYPRNDTIRWRFVVGHCFQMIMSILIGYIAICRVLVDNYTNIGIVPCRIENLFQILSTFIVFGFITFMLCFYGLLHLWHNIFAELMRFADRRFYSAWWESISLKEYYRKWNKLVQDWLFAYIYVPAYNYFQSATLATFMVILISGVVHEYIIALSLGFFFPLLFLSFVVFGQFYFVLTKNLKRTNIHNTIFLSANFLGWGILPALYSIEWYSRINCPKPNPSTLDLFVPRLFSCVKM